MCFVVHRFRHVFGKYFVKLFIVLSNYSSERPNGKKEYDIMVLVKIDQFIYPKKLGDFGTIFVVLFFF